MRLHSVSSPSPVRALTGSSSSSGGASAASAAGPTRRAGLFWCRGVCAAYRRWRRVYRNPPVKAARNRRAVRPRRPRAQARPARAARRCAPPRPRFREARRIEQGAAGCHPGKAAPPTSRVVPGWGDDGALKPAARSAAGLPALGRPSSTTRKPSRSTRPERPCAMSASSAATAR